MKEKFGKALGFWKTQSEFRKLCKAQSIDVLTVIDAIARKWIRKQHRKQKTNQKSYVLTPTGLVTSDMMETAKTTE